jgi:hypothetical protein
VLIRCLQFARPWLCCWIIGLSIVLLLNAAWALLPIFQIEKGPFCFDLASSSISFPPCVPLLFCASLSRRLRPAPSNKHWSRLQNIVGCLLILPVALS